MPSAAAILSQPISFPCGKRAPNRFLKSAMSEKLCTYSDTNPDESGKPTAEYLRLYEAWGRENIGIIVFGNVPISRKNLETKGNAIIDKDSTWDPVEAFRPVIAAAKAHGSLALVQLTHGGRQTPADINPHPVSSSDTRLPDAHGLKFAPARALTKAEIKDLVDRWAFGAETCYKAGADGIQLHCAHGYLLSQFLSPRVNKRTDEYGGSLENRSRIIFEIISEIRKRVPDPSFLLSIKYNSADFSDGGFSAEDSQKMAEKMEAARVELIELSGGTYENLVFLDKKESTKAREAFFLEFAERIRPHLTGKSRVCVTGGFRTASVMAESIAAGSTELIGLGRPLCHEPDACTKLLSGIGAIRANKIDPALELTAAYYQLRELASGRQPRDLTEQDEADKVTAILLGKREIEKHTMIEEPSLKL